MFEVSRPKWGKLNDFKSIQKFLNLVRSNGLERINLGVPLFGPWTLTTSMGNAQMAKVPLLGSEGFWKFHFSLAGQLYPLIGTIAKHLGGVKLPRETVAQLMQV
jgi:hypothetical protein